MSKKPVKNKKFFFIQDCGTFENQLLFVVGYTFDEFKKEAKKQKIDIKELIENHEIVDGIKDLKMDVRPYGFTAMTEQKQFLIVLNKFEDSWLFWTVLMHELHHVVSFLSEHRKLQNEYEILAYQQEYLFNKIRRKLQS